MIRTRVGYAGGTKENPTYQNLGDHSETIEIDFDPARITYEKLLEIYWENHDPISRSWSRQYMSIIFYHNEEQKKAALALKEREEKKRKTKVFTEILPYARFYLAEAYHQKYYLRNSKEIGREYTAVYPVDKDFVGSTAVARVNGYIAGYGNLSSLEEEIGLFGLSPEGAARLRETVKRKM